MGEIFLTPDKSELPTPPEQRIEREMVSFKRTSSKKPLFLLGGIFLVIIVGGLVIFTRLQKQPEVKSEPLPQESVVLPSPSPTPFFNPQATEKPKTEEEFYSQIGENIKKIFE